MTNKHLDELFELLAIPTISAQIKHDPDMQRACEWLKKRLESIGFTANILPTNGQSVVYAENLSAGAGKPTVLIYGHYDVQSPDPLTEWSSEPFKPQVRAGNIYARGAADDKGQLYTWIAAIDDIGKNLPVNIKFIIEGEEEVGSKNFDDFVEDNKSLLQADICVVSDSHCLSVTQPTICYGLRGLTYTQISVKTLPRDVHSGLYGGNVANPAIVLSQIITKLKDEDNRIAVPGFYDNVRKLSKSELSGLNKFPFEEHEIKEETGAIGLVGETGFPPAVRAGARPTLDVNGIWGGYIEEGQKTIIPGSVYAKISMRLVPNQEPNEIFDKFEKYVKSISPSFAEVEVKLLSTSDPVIMDHTSKYFKAATQAYKKTFGNKPLYELSGGSIGAVASIKKIIGTDCILMGYGLPDDGLHSPNEKFSITMFEKGIATNIEFLRNLTKTLSLY
jgi:acetylornithine deacetylase/succinyl-diaminopimelate desuccinylase-like protein